MVGERRWDLYGPFRLMAEAEGYVMARRPYLVPFIVSRIDWDNWSRVPVSDYDGAAVADFKAD